ncbi:hypothetical protein KC19_11G080000 [Ceratodon purpureus]|uniref:Secreted protein n=1 Tax=Ceratodon purpureus TaxID=3225 RepID=A0A8T0GCS2_CERPU|nr:hypothetical protein KC19_11G080000 [Ceratodon purpureus]
MLLLPLRLLLMPPYFRGRPHPELPLGTLRQRHMVRLSKTTGERPVQPSERRPRRAVTRTHCAVRIRTLRVTHPGVKRRVFPHNAIRPQRHLHKPKTSFRTNLHTTPNHSYARSLRPELESFVRKLPVTQDSSNDTTTSTLPE